MESPYSSEVCTPITKCSPNQQFQIQKGSLLLPTWAHWSLMWWKILSAIVPLYQKIISLSWVKLSIHPPIHRRFEFGMAKLK